MVGGKNKDHLQEQEKVDRPTTTKPIPKPGAELSTIDVSCNDNLYATMFSSNGIERHTCTDSPGCIVIETFKDRNRALVTGNANCDNDFLGPNNVFEK